MGKETLKNALFGYSKISVCRYIATMNEEFNAKLMAETSAFREEHSKLQTKIDDLEAELSTHKQNACNVGAILLEAGQYAEKIRQQAQVDAGQTQVKAATLLEQAQAEAAEHLKQAHEEAAEHLKQAHEEAAEFLDQTHDEAAEHLKQVQEEAAELLRQAQVEVAELLRQAQEEADQLRSQAKEEADQLRSQAKEETDQLLTTSQAQKQKLALYTDAIIKLREDMATLADKTDDALNTFVEQFLSLKQDFEDSEL